MTKTRSRMQIDWQLVIFFFIAYAIAWPIAFIFGVDQELIRSNHSPPAATVIIYLLNSPLKRVSSSILVGTLVSPHLGGTHCS